MEDTHLRHDDFNLDLTLGLDTQVQLWAVFDGHGGTDVSIWCQENFAKKLIRLNSFKKRDYKKATEEIFKELDDELLKVAKKYEWKSGATAVFVLNVGGDLYIGNIGDSEVVLGSFDKNSKIQDKLLSFKHKPSSNEEKNRIKEAGGHVIFGRVNGSLAVSRSFGDLEYKYPFNKGSGDFVTVEPFINNHKIVDEDEFLIISCDGLWDKMTYEDACNFVHLERLNGSSSTLTAEKLTTEALERGSSDNITVIIVYLKPPQKLSKNILNSKDTFDINSFLKIDCVAAKKEVSQNVDARLKKFKNLGKKETVIQEHKCRLGSSLLNYGSILITQNLLLFYSNPLNTEIIQALDLRDISEISRDNLSGVIISTKEGKKITFSWRSILSRDNSYLAIKIHLSKLPEKNSQKSLTKWDFTLI